ncbi:MAG: hypothetical protein WBH01_03645 [Dehalococcoidia bacterium]
MARKGFTPEQIINRLREAQIHINQGISITSHLDDLMTRDDRSQWYHRQIATVNRCGFDLYYV